MSLAVIRPTSGRALKRPDRARACYRYPPGFGGKDGGAAILVHSGRVLRRLCLTLTGSGLAVMAAAVALPQATVSRAETARPAGEAPVPKAVVRAAETNITQAVLEAPVRFLW